MSVKKIGEGELALSEISVRIFQQLGLGDSSQDLGSIGEWGGLPPGLPIHKPIPLFPKKDAPSKKETAKTERLNINAVNRSF